MIEQLSLFVPPAAPDADALLQRLDNELASWRTALLTMAYPEPLASALRCLIASAQAQIAALDDAELNEGRRAA